jgi:malate synthase
MGVKVEVSFSAEALRFPHLLEPRVVNGRLIDLKTLIGSLHMELGPLVQRALKERRMLLDSRASVRERYSFPRWDERFEDPVDGRVLTYREIVEGLINNLLGREPAWRLNEHEPIPPEVHPLKNPGLELTGPWHPLDMAIKQINADVVSIMGPDNEDAAPPDYRPYGVSESEPIGLWASRDNEKRILSGEIFEAIAIKRGLERRYRIEKPIERWPVSFHRIPGIHLVTQHVRFNGRPAYSFIVDATIHVVNNYESLRKIGRRIYIYVPKTQSPLEAFIIARLFWRLEQALGAERPGSIIKFKALYEEASLGRYLPIVLWIWRYWLIGLNVGRWDYTASLIEMWKDERVLPDPQNNVLMGMVSPHMMAYQRYNAVMMLLSGLNGREELTNSGAIGGMAAVMLYQESDPYGRARHNPVTLRAMFLDKLRERLIGLIFVTDKKPFKRPTLREILEGKFEGRLYDLYRQSWVASPDKRYVEAGTIPLKTPLEKLQDLVSAREEWVIIDGKPVAPSVTSGLTRDERLLFSRLGLLNEDGEITPMVIAREDLDAPEKLMKILGRDLWDALYDISGNEITVENIQHAFYMAANYGFQVLNGNLAAAIDDYKLFPGRCIRFMNDVATYRIFITWLWTLFNREASITRDGWIRMPALTQDGVLPARDWLEVKAGTRLTKEIFEKIWEAHNEWTRAFFDDFDRIAAIRVVASILADKYLPPEEREAAVDKVVQMLAYPPSIDTNKVLQIIKKADPREVSYMLEKVEEIKEILSETYGKYPDYMPRISYEEAAERISKILKISDREAIIKKVRAYAPRFDRSKAPLIMDILKRHILCPLYIQHPARVLFTIADKDHKTAKDLLGTIYYVDEKGNPIYRDENGNPSREKIIETIKKGELPEIALEIHDYIYDIILG